MRVFLLSFSLVLLCSLNTRAMDDAQSAEEICISSKPINHKGKKVLVFPQDKQIRIETGISKGKVFNFDDKFFKDGIRLKNGTLSIDGKTYNLYDY